MPTAMDIVLIVIGVVLFIVTAEVIYRALRYTIEHANGLRGEDNDDQPRKEPASR